MIKRIAVLGSGAIGSMVGGMLTKAGHDVTLVDQWPEHVEAMRKVGLRLSGTCGEHLVPVRALNIHELQSVAEPFDAIFIAVKSYDTEWVVSLALQYLKKPDGVLVDFQNGINDERVAALAGRERCLGCVITIGAGMYEPGHAIRTDRAAIGFKIGEHDGKAKELAGGRTSLLQDVLRGRRTEVQYLNGYVSEQGGKVGIPTPFNDKVVELITAVPPGTLKPDPKHLEPLVAMLPK